MRILDVAPWPHYPPNSGGAIRVQSLLTHLAGRHQVRQFSNIKAGIARAPNAIVEFSPAPGYRQFRFCDPYGMVCRNVIRQTYHMRLPLQGVALACSRPPLLTRLVKWADIVMVEYPWQVEYCRRLAGEKPVVLAGHNYEAQFFESVARGAGIDPETDPWVKWVRRLESRACRQADLVLTVSPEDRRAMIDAYQVEPERFFNAPNGADTDRIRPTDRPGRQARRRELGLPERPTVLFANSGYFPTGISAVSWIEKIAARTDRFEFLIAGGYFPAPETRRNITITGGVDDITPYFEAADFSLCPVAFGGGTKIKLLEAMAAGLPTVAFPEAVHGTIFRDEEHLLVSPHEERALIERLERLLDNPPLADELGRRARQATVENYDWGVIAKSISNRFEALVHAKGSPAASLLVESVA